MYRKLLASTALSLVMAGGAFAQEPAPAPADPLAPDAPAEAPQEPLVSAADTGINADGWLATEIIGETIYNSTAEDAESIGEVNDFVLDTNGEIGAVVVGVGGFLGIGQKNVAINWDELELIEGPEGEQRLVANMTREQLENAAEFDRAEWLASERAAMEQQQQMDAESQTAPADPAAPAPMAPADPATEQPAEEPADDAAADPAAEQPAEEPADDAAADPAATEEPADDMAAEEPAEGEAATEEQPAAEGEPADPATEEAQTAAETGETPADDAAAGLSWDDYQPAPVAEISADELTGTAVYGANDENIGDIGDVILSEDGQVQAVIVDFGGFLGIGTKPVAVSFENLEFLRDANGALVLRTNLTEEDLEAAPEYEEETYLQDPEGSTVVVQ